MDEYPKVDGSTVTIPLSEAVAASITNQTVEAIRPYILHNKTHQAYVNLIEKTADLIFVTGPSQEELELAKEANVELERVPIVSEGFVFLTHKDNPVESLSVSEVQDIYMGKITNWKEVGGEDLPIVAFQRPVNSGSQTGFLDLVMKGKTPMEAPTEKVIAEMGTLVDAVANFDQSTAAIGYSYYYYVTDMWVNDNVKLIEIDDVYPNQESISEGTYPFTTAYYAVFRKDSPQDSNVRKVVDFILSKAGQTLMEENGYVKVAQ